MAYRLGVDVGGTFTDLPLRRCPRAMAPGIREQRDAFALFADQEGQSVDRLRTNGVGSENCD